MDALEGRLDKGKVSQVLMARWHEAHCQLEGIQIQVRMDVDWLEMRFQAGSG